MVTSFLSRNIVLVGSITAGIVAGIYVIWGPNPKKRRKRRHQDTCPGLTNLGNTCFLNAIMQGIAPSSSVVHWLKSFVESHCRQDTSQFLASTLLKLLQVLNNDSVEFTDEYCASAVIRALRAKRWVISEEEQDAHELFHVLTETLDEEVSRFPAVIPLFHAAELEKIDEQSYQPSAVARSRSNTALPVLPGRQHDHPFRGLLASQLQCKRCSHKYPVQHDVFDSLSLSFPSTHLGRMTVDHLLKKFVRSETVQNVQCEGCAKLRKGEGDDSAASPPGTTFIKKLTIARLPRCLCMHVQRTVWLANGMAMKRFEHVSFPEVLNLNSYIYHRRRANSNSTTGKMAATDVGCGLVGGNKNVSTNRSTKDHVKCVSHPYSAPVSLLKALNYHGQRTGITAPSLQPVWGQRRRPVDVDQLALAYRAETRHAGDDDAYKLTAVVVHLGDVACGHFVTYRRAPSANGQHFPDCWLYTSDTLVKRVPLAQVLQSNAYMLFYEKM